MDNKALITQSPLVIEPLPGIGDIMWYLPHLRAIATQSPTKKIVLLTKKTSKADELLAAEHIIEDFIWLGRDRRNNKKMSQRHQGIFGYFKLANELKKYTFNKVWILHHSSFYTYVTWLAGIKNRIGYTSKKFNHFLTQFLVINKTAALTPREKSTALLENYDLCLDHYQYPLAIELQAQKFAQQLLESSNCKIKAVLGIGASDPHKCWPVEKFIQLTVWLLQLGWQVILCGATTEQKMASDIIAKCQNHPNLLNCTNQSLQQTVAILQQANYYIGNDTSLMNIAVNQGKKAWVFFGPTFTVYSQLVTPLISSDKIIANVSVHAVQQNIKDYLLNCD